ncbi:YlxR family protein [Agromyces atrinae]|uniref:YlxR family protein n=1 Tax=Agromyces atrinae TaxID=592376 RepID=A0A4V1R214_9MICO|nr:YlxR family protein [Agromyces atrinae]MCI2958997.1 YlxR family protein [Agromyces atrinae]RXZ85566.1 YlxR family protein [Agromyces atrinae]
MEAVRTCIGCRSRAPRSSLLRVVTRESQLIADPSATLPGRGAWLHPTLECFQLAVRRRAFGRALRVTGELEATHVENRLNGTVITNE